MTKAARRQTSARGPIMQEQKVSHGFPELMAPLNVSIGWMRPRESYTSPDFQVMLQYKLSPTKVIFSNFSLS